MFGCLFGHNFIPNIVDITADDDTCPANCSRCGKTEYWTFYKYSLYKGWLSISNKGAMTRDIVETLKDPWGYKKYEKVAEDINHLMQDDITVHFAQDGKTVQVVSDDTVKTYELDDWTEVEKN